jgi:hypothetical protein
MSAGCCSPLPAPILLPKQHRYRSLPLPHPLLLSSISSCHTSTTFFHFPASRYIMLDRGSKGVDWVAHLVEASRLVLGWIHEGLCQTMLHVIIDSPLQVVYTFCRLCTTPLSPVSIGSSLVIRQANRGGHLHHRLPLHSFHGMLPLVSLPCSKVVSKHHVVVRPRSCLVLHPQHNRSRTAWECCAHSSPRRGAPIQVWSGSSLWCHLVPFAVRVSSEGLSSGHYCASVLLLPPSCQGKPVARRHGHPQGHSPHCLDGIHSSPPRWRSLHQTNRHFAFWRRVVFLLIRAQLPPPSSKFDLSSTTWWPRRCQGLCEDLSCWVFCVCALNLLLVRVVGHGV